MWNFTRKRKRRAGTTGSEESEDEVALLETESLFVVAEGPWEVIECAFYMSEGGWNNLLEHIVRMLRIDFELCKRSTLIF